MAVGLALAGLLPASSPAQAQVVDTTWTEPANLSQSGGATAPRIAVDPSGTLHVVWKDLYAGMVYARGAGGQWDQPVPVDLPFADFDAQVLADTAGWIHAIWLNDERELYHQRVRAAVVGDATQWSEPAVVATDIGAFEVALDGRNQWHLAVVRVRETGDLPAGVYVMRSTESGAAWFGPSAVFLSPYFRTLIPPDDGTSRGSVAGADLAHVDVAATEVDGSTWVYVTWDHPAYKQVWFARSIDGGRTWGPALEVDAPSASEPYKLPQRIRVAAHGRELVLLWQAGLEGGYCSQAYSASTDGGDTWGETGSVFDDSLGCPPSLQLLSLEDGRPLLLASGQSQVYLLAWDGTRWSPPQAQPALTGFVNSENMEFVQLGCLQGVVFGAALYIAGCDTGDGGDIWFTGRGLGPIADWFAAASGWRAPVVLELGPVPISALWVGSGPGFGTGALWSQAGTDATAQESTSLYYASWGADQVTGPFPVSAPLPRAIVELVAAIEPGGRLLAFWVGGERDALQFSWANAVLANSASSWASPQVLSPADGIVRSPRVALSPSGTVHLLYSVPLNEGRGLYLRQSDDRGLNWSQPIQVYDAVAHNCPLVEQPNLVAISDNQLLSQWICSTLPGGIGPLALFQSQSTDGGQTWSSPKAVLERRVSWSQIVLTEGNQLHRVWLSPDPSGVSAWHAVSVDGGASWGRPVNIGLTERATGLASLASDSAGGLHLALAVQGDRNAAEIHYWAWAEQGWSLKEPVKLNSTSSPLTGLGAAVDPAGQLAVVYTRLGPPNVDGQAQAELGMISRTVGTPESAGPAGPTPAATATNTALPPGSILPIPPPTPSATPPLPESTSISPGASNSSQARLPGLAIGALSALVLVGGVAVVGVLRARNQRV